MGAIAFALLAALCNAVSVLTRHVASTADPDRPTGLRLVGYLLRNPRWLAGTGAQVGAFAFQAVALQLGQLSVVQPLLVTELVMALVLRRVWIRQAVAWAAWAGAAAIERASNAAGNRRNERIGPATPNGEKSLAIGWIFTENSGALVGLRRCARWDGLRFDRELQTGFYSSSLERRPTSWRSSPSSRVRMATSASSWAMRSLSSVSSSEERLLDEVAEE